MGCFGSRFDKRNSNAGDLNTVGLNFVGGEAHTDDGCPHDKVVFGYAGGEKDASEVFPKITGLVAEEEDLIKKIAQETFTAIENHLK